jgi:hypothetical protein
MQLSFSNLHILLGILAHFDEIGSGNEQGHIREAKFPDGNLLQESFAQSWILR